MERHARWTISASLRPVSKANVVLAITMVAQETVNSVMELLALLTMTASRLLALTWLVLSVTMTLDLSVITSPAQ